MKKNLVAIINGASPQGDVPDLAKFFPGFTGDDGVSTTSGFADRGRLIGLEVADETTGRDFFDMFCSSLKPENINNTSTTTSIRQVPEEK